MKAVLEARGISKTYPGGIRALDRVDFELLEGEVHALLGENGAGKSTLAKILYGLVYPDEGLILYRGSPVSLSAPRDALQLGILYVPQYPSMPRGVRVADVIRVYAESRGRGSVRDVVVASEELGWSLELEKDAGLLTLVERQRLMLSIALGLGADVLLLDEPTSFLSGAEAERVLDTVLKLRESGMSIVYITHRVDEVRRIANRATILRRGRVAGVIEEPGRRSPEELISMIAGRRVVARVERRRADFGREALVVEGLRVRDELGRMIVDGVSLSVRRGEIVSIVGIEGMGQRELMEAIAGVRKRDEGRVRVCGIEVDNVAGFRRAGGRYIHGDRLEALAPSLSLAENIVAPRHAAILASRGLLLLRSVVESIARRVVKVLSIAAENVWQPVASLSGGNQQKVLVGRESLVGDACLIVAHNPTAGLDVASSMEVLRLFASLADKGVGILFATPSVDEALAISDRILVLRRGRIVAEFERGVTREEVYHAIVA